jgi:hypothetical protein
MRLVMSVIGAAFGGMGGIMGGGIGAEAAGMSTMSLGSLYSFPGMASGGPVSARMPYLIGERGPELFVPNTSGSIVPNGKFGGGVTVVNNIVNESGTSIHAQQSGPVFDGEKWVQTIILKDVSSNGPIGQMLKSRR